MGTKKKISLHQIASLLIENCQLNAFSHITVTLLPSSFILPSINPASWHWEVLAAANRWKRGIWQESLWDYLLRAWMAFPLQMPKKYIWFCQLFWLQLHFFFLTSRRFSIHLAPAFHAASSILHKGVKGICNSGLPIHCQITVKDEVVLLFWTLIIYDR